MYEWPLALLRPAANVCNTDVCWLGSPENLTAGRSNGGGSVTVEPVNINTRAMRKTKLGAYDIATHCLGVHFCSITLESMMGEK